MASAGTQVNRKNNSVFQSMSIVKSNDEKPLYVTSPDKRYNVNNSLIVKKKKPLLGAGF